jgi:hypothetical protein
MFPEFPERGKYFMEMMAGCWKSRIVYGKLFSSMDGIVYNKVP